MGFYFLQSFGDTRTEQIKQISKELNIDIEIVEEKYDNMLDDLKEYAETN